MCLILLLNRTHSLVRQTTFFVFFRKLTSNFKYKLFHSYSNHYGLSPRVISLTSVLRGAAVSVQFGIYHIPHSFLPPLICYCLPVFDELCRRSVNFARSCISHESQLISQIASYCIYFARCNSPMGLNMLFCADRFQTNIDGILNSSSNYIVHSYYNCSTADVQLRASSFLFELVSIRDSRQLYFDNVAFTKAELTDIINHICTS